MPARTEDPPERPPNPLKGAYIPANRWMAKPPLGGWGVSQGTVGGLSERVFGVSQGSLGGSFWTFLFVLFLPQKSPLCLAHSRKNRTRLRIREFQTHSQTTGCQWLPFFIQSPKLLFLCREARTTSPKGLFRHPAEALSRSDGARLSRRVWPFRPSARPKFRFRYASGPLPHPFSALFDRLAPTTFCMLLCVPGYHPGCRLLPFCALPNFWYGRPADAAGFLGRNKIVPFTIALYLSYNILIFKWLTFYLFLQTSKGRSK